MAVVTAPLLSFSAAGQIAKTQVYASWKGIPYVRRYVIPAQPASAERDKTQNVFRWLQEVFQFSEQKLRDVWDTAASGRQMTGRNLLTQKNLPILRPLTALTGMIGSPGAKGGVPTSFALTDTSTTIVATPVVPTVLPAGWTVVGATAVAILAQNPQTAVDYDTYYSADASGPDWVATISGLVTGTDYMVASWLIYQRSTSTTDLAYGPATFVAKSTS